MKNPKLAKLKEEWILEVSIDEIQTAMEAEEITAKELVLLYLDRIASFNKNGISINAVLEVNPDVLQIAEALDTERKISGPRGPMHGIPVLLKDNIDTGDKLHTSAGSLALKNSYASQDSSIAELLREAGAIILGKTNMTEWANFMAEDMPTGYSSRGGQVLNPYGPGKFEVGGSSSGSGAAIAANFATVAIGTETSGSILSPASRNSLVGIKPTVGLISRTGIIPIAHTQDTAGPMTRTVKDAAILLNAITGKDDTDPATFKNMIDYDYTEFLVQDGLQGKRIGIARDRYFDYLSDEEKSCMEEAIAVLKEKGATIIDSVEIPSTKEKWDYNVLVYEFKTDLNAYLQNVDPRIGIQSLADVIRFNNKNADATLKYGQKVLLESEATSGTLTEPEYINSLEQDQYLSTEQGIDYTLHEHNLDAIVFPNNYGAGIPAKAGYPSITVPAGYSSDNGPVGITFTGTAFTEPVLIEIAYAYEQATKVRKPPIMK
ncbi:amidase family protein [Bacillus suaedaesalsae]|uniref:Amidase n=1 Tax=Bacillus suaedaesalsae TaxID=2810349 RepID=A0ABS2DE88_9BACI|nr:amidase family protein [Bacillus suaedaesalsae]MBM6616350.1 amidase [Bacillus suaedaesalsae]